MNKSLKFTSANDYLSYRAIVAEKISYLSMQSQANDSPDIREALLKWNKQIQFIDAILNSAFYNGVLEEVNNGLLIDPILHPTISIPDFQNSLKQLGTGISEKAPIQKTIDFKETTAVKVTNQETGEKKIAAIVKGKVPVDEIEKAVFDAIHGGKTRHVGQIVDAAKIYAEKKKLDLEKLGYAGVLDNLIETYPGILDYPMMRSFCKFNAEQIKQYGNPVVPYFNLKYRMPTLSEKEAGDLLEFFVNQYVKRAISENKTLTNDMERSAFALSYLHGLDGPYRVAVGSDPKTRLPDASKVTVICDNRVKQEILSDPTTMQAVISAITKMGDQAKTEYLVEKNGKYEFVNGMYNRLVQIAYDNTSPVRKLSLEERRAKKQEGKLEKKPYVEKGYPA